MFSTLQAKSSTLKGIVEPTGNESVGSKVGYSPCYAKGQTSFTPAEIGGKGLVLHAL